MTDAILGRRVIATNEAGGRWRGRCVTFTLDGKAVVEYDAVDIGYGWESVKPERRAFDADSMEVDGWGKNV